MVKKSPIDGVLYIQNNVTYIYKFNAENALRRQNYKQPES